MRRLFGIILLLFCFEKITICQTSDLDFKLQSVVDNDVSNARLYFKAPCNIRLVFVSTNINTIDRVLYFSNPILNRVATQKEQLCKNKDHNSYTYTADISLKISGCLEEKDRIYGHINNAYCEVVSYRLNIGMTHNDNIKGDLRTGTIFEIKYPDKEKVIRLYVKFQRENKETTKWYFKEMRDLYEIGASPCYLLFYNDQNGLCYELDGKIRKYEKGR